MPKYTSTVPQSRVRAADRKPQRDARDRLQQLDDALDHQVDGAAEVAGDAAEQDAQPQAHDHPTKPIDSDSRVP